MTKPNLRVVLRPGLRALVLGVSGALVVSTALLVSINVSDHLERAAVNEAIRTTEAVVRGYIDPSVTGGGLANPASLQGTKINADLERLVAAGKILRIKVWATDGTIAFSDLPALRGRRFDLDDDLRETFEGNVATEFTSADDEENIFEHGLAESLLAIHLPIRSQGTGTVVGAYEVYEDAAPILADIAQTRQDVLLIVGGLGLGLLALLFAAFSGASRRLTSQNRRLVEQSLTEQVLTAEVRRSQERFRSLVQNSADVSMIVRADGIIEYESATVEQVMGFPADDRVGLSAFGAIHPDDIAWGRQLLEDVVRSPGAMVSGELRVQHADGSWRWIEATAKNLFDDPAVGGVVVNYRDITTRRTLEDELRHQAFHDSLTGLANRALFVDRLDHALSLTRRNRRPLAVLFIDLDDFKTINDSLGHGEGDAILVEVAARLSGALRTGDTIARMGGDEFAVLVEDPPAASGSIDVAGRLLAVLQAPFAHAGKELFVHASVGVANLASREQTADELLRNADIAMYMAKSKGKNRIEVYEPSMHAAALARLALKGDLERALERGEFFVLYQPVVDLSTLELVGVEALLRWQHPERGVVGPTEFIPVAEETGLIIPLGRWVLDQACRQSRAWDLQAPARPLAMNVNVSGRQVSEPGFVAEVAAVLAETGVDADRLVLEFTEGVLMQDTEATKATLRSLKSLGIRLAIDDFGTGYSSLSYVRQFPIDVLKIDRSFVASMSAGPGENALMGSILKLSETLHLQTVAEGIEDIEQLAELQTLGADLGQGYLFAKPLPSTQISKLLAASGWSAQSGLGSWPVGVLAPSAHRGAA
jgi:diguanylate cyclase (GGDEF)-like protein/PAS domain S-box-containing protein